VVSKPEATVLAIATFIQLFVSKALLPKASNPAIIPLACRPSPRAPSKFRNSEWLVQCPNLDTFEAIRLSPDNQNKGPDRMVPAVTTGDNTTGYLLLDNLARLRLEINLPQRGWTHGGPRGTKQDKEYFRVLAETVRLDLENGALASKRLKIDVVKIHPVKETQPPASSSSSSSSSSYSSTTRKALTIPALMFLYPTIASETEIIQQVLAASTRPVAGMKLPPFIKIQHLMESVKLCYYCNDTTQHQIPHTDSNQYGQRCPSRQTGVLATNPNRSKPLLQQDGLFIQTTLLKDIPHSLTMGMDDLRTPLQQCGLIKVIFKDTAGRDKGITALAKHFKLLRCDNPKVWGCQLCFNPSHAKKDCTAQDNQKEFYQLCPNYGNASFGGGPDAHKACARNCSRGGHPASIIKEGQLLHPKDVERYLAKLTKKRAEQGNAKPNDGQGPGENPKAPRKVVIPGMAASTGEIVHPMDFGQYFSTHLSPHVDGSSYVNWKGLSYEMIRAGAPLNSVTAHQFGGHGTTTYSSNTSRSEGIDMGRSRYNASDWVNLVGPILRFSTAPRCLTPAHFVDLILHLGSSIGVDKPMVRYNLCEQGIFYQDHCSCPEGTLNEGATTCAMCTVRTDPHTPKHWMLQACKQEGQHVVDEPYVSEECFVTHVAAQMTEADRAKYSHIGQAKAFLSLTENRTEVLSMAQLQAIICRLKHKAVNLFVVTIVYDPAWALVTNSKPRNGSDPDEESPAVAKGNILNLLGRGYSPSQRSVIIVRKAILAFEGRGSQEAVYRYVFSVVTEVEGKWDPKEAGVNSTLATSWEHEHPLVQRLLEITGKASPADRSGSLYTPHKHNIHTVPNTPNPLTMGYCLTTTVPQTTASASASASDVAPISASASASASASDSVSAPPPSLALAPGVIAPPPYSMCTALWATSCNHNSHHSYYLSWFTILGAIGHAPVDLLTRDYLPASTTLTTITDTQHTTHYTQASDRATMASTTSIARERSMAAAVASVGQDQTASKYHTTHNAPILLCKRLCPVPCVLSTVPCVLCPRSSDLDPPPYIMASRLPRLVSRTLGRARSYSNCTQRPMSYVTYHAPCVLCHMTSTLHPITCNHPIASDIAIAVAFGTAIAKAIATATTIDIVIIDILVHPASVYTSGCIHTRPCTPNTPHHAPCTQEKDRGTEDNVEGTPSAKAVRVGAEPFSELIRSFFISIFIEYRAFNTLTIASLRIDHRLPTSYIMAPAMVSTYFKIEYYTTSMMITLANHLGNQINFGLLVSASVTYPHHHTMNQTSGNGVKVKPNKFKNVLLNTDGKAHPYLNLFSLTHKHPLYNPLSTIPGGAVLFSVFLSLCMVPIIIITISKVVLHSNIILHTLLIGLNLTFPFLEKIYGEGGSPSQ
jgi:hypothetical protein